MSDLVGVWVWMIGTGLGVGVVGHGLSEHFPRTHVELAGVRSYSGLSARAFSLGPDDDLRGFCRVGAVY